MAAIFNLSFLSIYRRKSLTFEERLIWVRYLCCSLVQCLLAWRKQLVLSSYLWETKCGFVLNYMLVFFFSATDLPSILRVNSDIKQECKTCTLLPQNCIKRWNITILKCLHDFKCRVKVYPWNSYEVPYLKSTPCAFSFFLLHNVFAFRNFTTM